MIENLLPIELPPGIFANGTRNQAKGRWNDGNLVRFHEGTVRPIGGWQQTNLVGAAISGTVHASISWALADGTPFMACGTEDGLYVIDNDEVVHTITPTTGATAPYNWQLSVFGTYLVATNSLLGDDDLSATNVFVWTGDVLVPATAAYTPAVGPRGAYSAFATPERFLTILRGEDPTGAPPPVGITPAYSERRVYWASQETIDDYISTDTNTGGNFDLTTDGRLICGTPSRGQSLLWTDVDIWTMNFIGGQLVYSFANVGKQCGIVSKRAFVVLDKGAFWMGRGKFFVFDGFVRNVPCDVSDVVFGDFNESRAHTVWALANPRFNEVTWFYPSAASLTPNRYVTFNYEENHWTRGIMQRSSGVPQRFRRDVIDSPKPFLFDGSLLWQHETGQQREAQAYLISGPVQLGAGDRLMRLQGIMPDDRNVGDVALYLYTSMAPDALEKILGPFSLTASTPLRTTARHVRVKLAETAAVDWRVGAVSLAVIPAERRGLGDSALVDNTPAFLEIIPNAITLSTGKHFTFSAIVTNAAGQVLPIQPDRWFSDSPAQVSIDDTGTITAHTAPCVVNITAQLTSAALTSNPASVTVAARVPASIVIAPTLSVELDQTLPITYSIFDASGVSLTGIPISLWESDNTAIASVDSTGAVTGHALTGTCNVHAHITSPPLVSNACGVTDHTAFYVHVFTATSALVVTAGATTGNALVVGAGGGGAFNLNGGGGGEVATGTFAMAVGSIPVSVGVGGGHNGGAGGASQVGTVLGHGGGGGTGLTGGNSGSGYAGGSGGGVDDNIPPPGGPNGAGAGGGGGGSGGPGGTATTSGVQATGGAGGIGTLASIPGVAAARRGGGGGSYGDSFGSGGFQSGGGTDGGGSAPGGAGTSGGGGGGGDNVATAGGLGGNGIVYISYRQAAGIVATGGTKTLVTL